MVFLEHRLRVYYVYSLYYSSRSHGTVCTTTCKGRNYCRPRDPTSWQKMAAMPDDCERTATVALQTAASAGFISGELGISAAFDAFSTVYELPPKQTVRQTDKQTNKLDGVPRTQTSRLLLSYYSSRSHGTVCTTTCKGRNYCRPRDPPHGKKMAAIPDDCERTATVALPTAASPGLMPTITAPLPH